MAVGTLGSIVFSTYDKRILTPNSLSKTAGSSWAVHETIGGKQKTEYMGPELQTLTFEMTISAELGVRPRELMKQLEEMAEGREAHLLVIGGKLVGDNPWRLVSLSEEWGTVLNRGELISAKVTVSLEEYV